MGKRTISSAWRQYEKLSAAYLNETKPREETLEKLRDLTEKANRDKIGDALATLFVKPYVSLPLSVQFTMEMPEGEIPKWHSRYDEENSRLLLHPLSICAYLKRIEELQLTEDDYEDFVHVRYLSFLKEIGKLPSIYVLFMLVLQRVAYMLEIAHLEKRGGIVEVAEGESYHTLLWALKEIEHFARRTAGTEVRSEYGISWYESDWITGR